MTKPLLAIDYGQVRSGIAITDPLQIIASGLTTVYTSDLLDFLIKRYAQEPFQAVIIGYPKGLNNQINAIEEDIQDFIKKLENKISQVPIYRYDERFTSKMAFQTLIDSGLKKQKRQNKALIDQISATILLQSYLNWISQNKSL